MIEFNINDKVVFISKNGDILTTGIILKKEKKTNWFTKKSHFIYGIEYKIGFSTVIFFGWYKEKDVLRLKENDK